MYSTSDQERMKALKADIESLDMKITGAVIASLFSSTESCRDYLKSRAAEADSAATP